MKNKKQKSKSKPDIKKNKLKNKHNTEEDEEDLEDLIENFRDVYITNPTSNLQNNDQDVSVSNSLATISIDEYKQPEITSDVQKKILELQALTKSIERNLVQSVCAKKKNKKFKIDYGKRLNKMQYLAATTIKGPLLVIAGAGSGKTRTIVYRTAFLLENGIPPQNILLLTFTRKAADEMIARTDSLLNDTRSQKVMGGTFHSFANNLLRKHAKLLNIPPNFTIIDTADSEDVLDFIRRELHFGKRDAFPKKGTIQKIISYSRNCKVPIKRTIENRFEYFVEFAKDIKIMEKIYSEYKKAHNLFDFDDLMEFLRDSLKKNSRFRKKVQDAFQYIMVDEFQDTNIIQKEIVDLIAKKHRNIMVVGDDSQSIYSFRGANFENILRFPETYTDCKFVKLEQNYRSTQKILDFTNSVISNAKIGYKKELFSTKGKGNKPIVRRFYSGEDEAEYVVSEIINLREHGIPLNQIAILCRAMYHSDLIQGELIRRKIPFIVVGGIRFSERRHVKDIVAYLRIALNPLDAVAWNRVLKLIPNIGNTSASRIIKQIRKLNGKIDFSNFKGNKFYEDLQELGSILTKISGKKVPIPNKVEILKEYYSPILANVESDYKIRLMDIDVLHSLARKYNNLEKFLSNFALDPPSNKFQNQNFPMLDEEIEEKPLVVSTIHSAKGLEWNTVFIPHLIDGLFPNFRALDDIEKIEEERRLFYVACTRAKERLYLTMPFSAYSYSGNCTLPSRFLIEVDEEKYDFVK